MQRLTRIRALENGLGIISRSQEFRTHASLSAMWKPTIGAPVMLASSTGPGFTT